MPVAACGLAIARSFAIYPCAILQQLLGGPKGGSKRKLRLHPFGPPKSCCRIAHGDLASAHHHFAVEVVMETTPAPRENAESGLRVPFFLIGFVLFILTPVIYFVQM